MKLPTTKILPNLQGRLDNVEYGNRLNIAILNINFNIINIKRDLQIS